MLKKVSKLIIVLIAIGFSSALIGQNSTSSPYSMFGVGDIANNSFGRSLGMGGVSTPLVSSYSLNPSNPASYIGLMQYAFIFDVGLSANNYILSTPQGSANKFDANIRYIAIGFSISKWWKAGVGLRPLTDIGYNIAQEYVLDYDSTVMSNQYTGEGGVNSFYFDNSFKVYKSLSLGLKLGYVFGSVKRTGLVTSLNDNSKNEISSVNRKIFDAFSMGFGAHYHQSLSDNLYLNVGATYNLKTNLATSYERLVISKTTKSNGVFSDTLFDGTIKQGDFILPQNFSIGSSLLIKQKLELAFDYQLEKWSESTFFGEAQNFKDNERLSFGVEFLPQTNAIKYFNAIRYRAGFSKSNSYLVFDNQQIKQIGGSIGFGFPLRSGSLINVAINYNKRSVPNDDRLEESYFQLHLNFSLQSSWFYRPKFE